MTKRTSVPSAIGAPHKGMTHVHLVERHKQLEVLLQVEVGKRIPDETQMKRIKQLKVLYKTKIAGLSQQQPSAEICELSPAKSTTIMRLEGTSVAKA